MKRLFLILFLLLAGVLSAQQPTTTIFGSGPPGGQVAYVVGTHYIDQSVSPAVLYICTSVSVAAGPIPPAGTQTCNWTQASPAGPNCSSSASPAVCGASTSGSVVVAAGATTVQVNTTAVTANSQILLTRDDSLGTKLSVTCNTATVMGEMKVSARTAGTNFTITVQTTPSANPGCISFTIIN